MKITTSIKYLMIGLGLNIWKLRSGLKGLRLYIRDYRKFKKRNDADLFPVRSFYPIFSDRFDNAGSMSGHYYHQDFYVAKQVFESKPEKHLDIGSRVDGFVAHVAVFREIWLVDVRPVESKTESIKFLQADLTEANKQLADFADSVSCLHAIEHFGLGRYNDPVDPQGHIKGLDNIYNCIKEGGKFYFSTPIGPQRVEFNAHRVFSIRYLLDYFSEKYDLVKFSYVDDKGDFHEGLELTEKLIEMNCGCNYGCGIFELVKRKPSD